MNEHFYQYWPLSLTTVTKRKHFGWAAAWSLWAGAGGPRDGAELPGPPLQTPSPGLWEALLLTQGAGWLEAVATLQGSCSSWRVWGGGGGYIPLLAQPGGAGRSKPLRLAQSSSGPLEAPAALAPSNSMT